MPLSTPLRRAVLLGSGAALPTPPVANPLLWLDASAITGLADGAAVTTWMDLSGYGRHATQATAGSKPTYKTAIQNGRAVVRFDGTADCMQAPSITWGAAMTVMVVVRGFASGGSHQIIFEIGDTSSGNGLATYFTPATTVPEGVIKRGAQIEAWTADSISDPKLLTVWADIDAAAGSQCRVLTNGTETGASGTTDAVTGTVGAQVVNLAARSQASLFAAIDLCEVAAYGSKLSGADITTWANYAVAKWGLT